MKKMVLDEKNLNGLVLASLPSSVLQATEIWVGLETRPAPHKVSLAGQTLTRGERVWSNSHHHLVSNTPRISWRVN